MPIFSYGTYTVHFQGIDSDSDFVRYQPMQFDYFPYPLVIGGLALLLCGLAIGFQRWIDSAYSATAGWIYVPALLGVIGLLFAADNQYVFLSLPPIVVTATLLAWRWRKPEHSSSAFFSAFLYNTLIVMGLMLVLMGTRQNVLFGVALSGLLNAATLVFPLIIIRRMIRRKYSVRRLILGGVIGIVVVWLPIQLILSLMGAPADIFLAILGYLASAVIPFLVLIRWNAWSRDVVTGAMFRKV